MLEETLEQTLERFSSIIATSMEVVFLRINHFAAMVLFALLIATAFAALGQRNGLERLRYAIWSFALFILIGVGIAWLMYPFSR
jgi:hypothetical protein